MAADNTAGGGISQIENHYKTFVVRLGIARIATTLTGNV